MIKKVSAICFLVCFSFTILVILPSFSESGFGFLQTQDLTNSSNTTVSNSLQILNNGTAVNSTQISKAVQITSAESKGPTDGNSVDIDLQIQPYPVTENAETQFMITFLQPSSQNVQVHVDYDFAITNSNNEVYRASTITGQPLIHTAEGIAKIPYKFTENGEYSLQVSVMGINFIPIRTEHASFELNVG